MIWVLSTLLGVASLVAALGRSFTSSVLALWCVNLLFGCIALHFGAEFIALLVWVLGSSSTVAFLAYGSTFGEILDESEGGSSRLARAAHPRGKLAAFLPVGGLLVSVALGWTFLLGVKGLALPKQGAESALSNAGVPAVARLGEALGNGPMLALLIVGVGTFLTIVGVGAISRPRVLKRDLAQGGVSES